MLNYASAVLNDGLLLLEFKDAIREGDSSRILRCWKVLLLYYRSAQHTNYASEAFHFIAQVTAMESQRTATQLLESRVVNITGKEGHNVPVDMHMEHLNRTLKGYAAGVGANISSDSIIQLGKSLNGMMAVTESFDMANNIHRSSTKHTRKSAQRDEDQIIEELSVKSRVFDYIPGRTRSCKRFQNIQPNVTTKMDKTKLFEWLAGKKKEAKRYMRFVKLHGHTL